MKIGLIIDYFDPQRGGAEQWTYQHAQQLLARGHEVHVIARGFSPAGVKLEIVAHRLESDGTLLGKAKAVERLLPTLSLDVVHDSGLGWDGQLLLSHDGSRLAQWERKLQILPAALRPVKRLMMRFLPRYVHTRRLLERQFGDPARIIVALSKMCACDYEHYHGVPPERIRLIYNGVDPERFHPRFRPVYRASIRQGLAVDDEEVLFVFVGHDFRRKGLGTAIRAVERLAAEGHRVRLAVVGGKRRDLALRLSDAQRRLVTLAGAIEDPVPYYAAADAFVLPTFYDPCSLSVFEAAACGLPCITTRLNGAGELLSEGVDGFVCDDPADDRQFAQRMRTLLDPAVRQRMGEAARQFALRHSLERNCEEMLGVYREIVERSARPKHGVHWHAHRFVH